jgi:hypothetical protein
MAPSKFDTLRVDTKNETMAFLKLGLAATSAPDRRDRVELTDIAYHWPKKALSLRLPLGHRR